MSKRQRTHTNWRWVSAALGLTALLVAGSIWWWLSQPAIGPRPISQLTTRDFHSLAFSPTEPDTVFFGHHGGLLVSDDGGRHWQTTTLQNADAMALALPLSDSQIMYAAGHNVFYKSTDAGATWLSVSSNLPGTDIHGFAVDPADANHVYAFVVNFGLYTSPDGGTTWAELSSAVPPTTFNLAVGEANQLYLAAGEMGLWHSADGGQTWTPFRNLSGGAITVAYYSGKLYAATQGPEAGLYVSSDAGANWTRLGLSGPLLAVAVNPQAPNRLIAVNQRGEVFASRDAGQTWGGN